MWSITIIDLHCIVQSASASIVGLAYNVLCVGGRVKISKSPLNSLRHPLTSLMINLFYARVTRYSMDVDC